MNYIKLDAPLLNGMNLLSEKEIARIIKCLAVLIENPTWEQFRLLTPPDDEDKLSREAYLLLKIMYLYIKTTKDNDNGRA